MFETEKRYKLEDIPETINISNNSFVIVGAIVFIPPIMETDIGHYIAAVKFNNQWQIYDDYDPKSPKIKSAKSNVLIHALVYVVPEH